MQTCQAAGAPHRDQSTAVRAPMYKVLIAIRSGRLVDLTAQAGDRPDDITASMALPPRSPSQGVEPGLEDVWPCADRLVVETGSSNLPLRRRRRAVRPIRDLEQPHRCSNHGRSCPVGMRQIGGMGSVNDVGISAHPDRRQRRMMVAVGKRVTPLAAHISRRALLTYRALPSGSGIEAVIGRWM